MCERRSKQVSFEQYLLNDNTHLSNKFIRKTVAKTIYEINKQPSYKSEIRERKENNRNRNFEQFI